MKQKYILLWVLLGLMGLMLVHSVRKYSQPTAIELGYGTFRAQVRQGWIDSVRIEGKAIYGQYLAIETAVSSVESASENATDRGLPVNIAGKSFVTTWMGTGDQLTEFLEKNHIVNFHADMSERPAYLRQLGYVALGIVVFLLLAFFIIRQIQIGGGKALNFGKSRARLLTENQAKVTFADVAGVEEAKEELEEIIAFLKEPKKFTRLGGRIPKGVLLVGSPGTGKTLLARAIAGEAGVPFLSISGSDFVEMFVGVGASRVRDLFEQAKRQAPCIVFIDEIDAVGRQRGAGLGGGHDEREQTLNQLLVEMDGFEFNDGVILIAASNRPDVLDPALLRPGRFDRHVVILRPDVKGREGILKVHTTKVPLDATVDLSVLARGTSGFTGADLQNLVNEAALNAARQTKQAVFMDDFEHAKDKIVLGKERRSMLISEDEKRVTSYHEAGHTLVAKMINNADPVHKVTIIPRGMALGLTHQLPAEDKYLMNQDYAEARIAILMGGRLAEELVFGKRTTGAGNDIEQATELARKMVCEWGMSDALGPLAFREQGKEIFLARELSRSANYSEKTAQLIDGEMARLINENFQRAKSILQVHRAQLDGIAEALLKYETLDGQEIDLLVAGGSLDDVQKLRQKNGRLDADFEPLSGVEVAEVEGLEKLETNGL